MSASRTVVWRAFLALVLACAVQRPLAAQPQPAPVVSGEELARSSASEGRVGGRLVVALRSEPKTLNPVVSVDSPSREVIGRMVGDLIHINRATHATEPALAKSWKTSKDGLRYTLNLRKGIRFSDGVPLTADDIVFSFQVYLDESVHSPQRDLLVIGGKPITVRKLNPVTVQFELARPYAAAERLFDSVAILPKHLLQKDYQAGNFSRLWTLNVEPSKIAGAGPFRLKQYVPGERLILERNPFYWKSDTKGIRLPYIDEIVFLFIPNQDAQVLRFKAGETDLLDRISPDNYVALENEQRGFKTFDLGPGLEYNFLFFNLNRKLPAQAEKIARKQKWFQDVRFRQAVSLAIDREGMNRLVYRGRGAPLSTHVTPAYREWVNPEIPRPRQSVEKARGLLASASFQWQDGLLMDAAGQQVEFTVLSSASNAQRTQMATIIQADLKAIGITAQVVPMDFRALIDRVFQTHDYEAVVLALGGGDIDPNPQMNVWLSNGSSHLWNLGQQSPATAWEAEIDTLMKQQLTTLDFQKRRKLYGRVQQLVADHLPLICLVSPHILVAAKERLGNFKPAILEHYTLWNADELFWAPGSATR
jgi:peptide/nickel transport system substrate-binding protein